MNVNEVREFAEQNRRVEERAAYVYEDEAAREQRRAERKRKAALQAIRVLAALLIALLAVVLLAEMEMISDLLAWLLAVVAVAFCSFRVGGIRFR